MHAFHASGGSYNHLRVIYFFFFWEPAEEFGARFLDLCLFIQLGQKHTKATS